MYLKLKHMRVKRKRYLCPKIYYHNNDATIRKTNDENFQYLLIKRPALTHQYSPLCDVFNHISSPNARNKLTPFSKYTFLLTTMATFR